MPVQVEPEGAVFRMRRRGEVLRLQWQPDGAPGAEDDQRTRFLAECVRPWDPGRGDRRKADVEAAQTVA